MDRDDARTMGEEVPDTPRSEVSLELGIDRIRPDPALVPRARRDLAHAKAVAMEKALAFDQAEKRRQIQLEQDHLDEKSDSVNTDTTPSSQRSRVY